jgi:predicted secreted acid phosphatase
MEALKACIAGCSLKALRQMIAQRKQDHKKKTSSIKSTKRGRVASRVNMGSTLKPRVVQTIVEAVLDSSAYQKYAGEFVKVNWDQLEQAAQAFKKLITLLEQEYERQL